MSSCGPAARVEGRISDLGQSGSAGTRAELVQDRPAQRPSGLNRNSSVKSGDVWLATPRPSRLEGSSPNRVPSFSKTWKALSREWLEAHPPGGN